MVHSGAHPIGSGLVHRRPSLPNAAGPKKRKKRSKKKMNTGENKSSKITLEEEEHEEKKQEPSSDIRESEARESSEEDADDERRSEDLSRLDSAQGSSEDDEGQNVRIGVWNSQMKLSTDTTALVLMSAYERYKATNWVSVHAYSHSVIDRIQILVSVHTPPSACNA